MIHILQPPLERVLAWVNGGYRDQAGHVWKMNEVTETLTSIHHDASYPSQYKVVPLGAESDKLKRTVISGRKFGKLWRK